MSNLIGFHQIANWDDPKIFHKELAEKFKILEFNPGKTLENTKNI